MAQKKCDGTRKEKTCGGDVFACRNCGAAGCRKNECANRQFIGNAQCADCSHTHVMVAVKEQKKIVAAKIRDASLWDRINIDVVFVAGLALLAIIAATVTLLSGKPGIDRRPVQMVASDDLAPGFAAAGDVCECYKKGFKLADQDDRVLSADYSTGFVLCRELHGENGGQAWTAGWNARMSARPFEASCRSYLKRSI